MTTNTSRLFAYTRDGALQLSLSSSLRVNSNNNGETCSTFVQIGTAVKPGQDRPSAVRLTVHRKCQLMSSNGREHVLRNEVVLYRTARGTNILVPFEAQDGGNSWPTEGLLMTFLPSDVTVEAEGDAKIPEISCGVNIGSASADMAARGIYSRKHHDGTGTLVEDQGQVTLFQLPDSSKGSVIIRRGDDAYRVTYNVSKGFDVKPV